MYGLTGQVRAWIGTTSVGPGVDLDVPTTICWEHENGVRASEWAQADNVNLRFERFYVYLPTHQSAV